MADPTDWQDEPADWVDVDAPSKDESDLRTKEHVAKMVGELLGKADVATHKEPLLKRGMDMMDAAENATRGSRAGLAQGLSRGFSDELEGGVGAVLASGGLKINDRNDISKGLSLREPAYDWAGLKKAYDETRDARRADIAAAKKDQPIQYVAGDLAGSMVGPGPGGATKLARGVGGALTGGTRALGSSDAPLGSLDEAEDVGLGAGGGVVTNLVGGTVADKFSNKAEAVKAASREAQQRIADKSLNSARGALGGEVSAGSRTLEVLEKAASDNSLPADVRNAAHAFLSSPEAAALKAQVARSSASRGIGQLGRIQSARDAMSDAASATEPAAVDAANAAKLADVATPITSRLKTLAQRFGPGIALGALGALTGGTHDAILGMGAGSIVGAGLGKPGTIIANMLKDPAVAHALANGGAGLIHAATQGAVNEVGEHAEDARKASQNAWHSLLHKDEEQP